VQEYAIEKLGIQCVELKWGQGAKDIGGMAKSDVGDRGVGDQRKLDGAKQEYELSAS